MNLDDWALVGGGVLLGIAATCATLSLHRDPGSFIHDFQSLISGILALFGAAITVFYMHRQWKQDEKTKAKNARAILSITLSTTIEYAQDCVEFCKQFQDRINVNKDAGAIPPDISQVPALPLKVVDNLREGAVHLPGKAGRELGDFLAFLQIFESRIRLLARSDRTSVITLGSYTVKNVAMEAMRVKLAASRLFVIARKDTSFGDETTVAQALGISDEEAEAELPFSGFATPRK